MLIIIGPPFSREKIGKLDQGSLLLVVFPCKGSEFVILRPKKKNKCVSGNRSENFR